MSVLTKYVCPHQLYLSSPIIDNLSCINSFKCVKPIKQPIKDFENGVIVKIYKS